MSKITVISKLTHKETVTDGSLVTLNDASVVKIHAGRADIAGYERVNNDLIVKLNSGETITLKNFYANGANGISQLVLEESNGALWWIADPLAVEHYQSIASLDMLLAGTASTGSGEFAAWPWVVGGLAVAGGIALAAGGGGGGGGGGDDNNPGNPNPVPPDNTPPGAPGNLRVSADGKQLSGTAEANSQITITDANGNVVGRGTTNGNGEFTVDLNTPYKNGETLTATPTDGAGNVGPGSSVTAGDTTAPDAPLIATVSDDVGSITGALTSGQTTDDNRPSFTGSGEPGATITVYDNGVAIGTTLVNSDGSWAFTPANALGEGVHAITTRATDRAGNVGPESASFTLTVDTIAPDAPSGVTVNDTTGTVLGPVAAGASTDATQPELSGRGEAGSTITLYDNGQVVGQTTVDANGNWRFTPSNPLAEGPHSITLTETDLAGNTSAPSAAFEFVVDRTPPAQPSIELNEAGTEITGSAEPNSTIVITNNQGVVVGTGQADANGAFTIPLNETQNNGQVLSVVASDAAGNPSIPATVVAPDTIAPDAPSNLTVAPEGNSVSGNAEPGATVTIRTPGGDLLGSGEVGPDGTFTIGISPAQTNGETLSLVATDGAGNSSEPVQTDAPDTTAPLAPTDLEISEDGAIVTGNAEPGSTVTVRVGDTIVGQGTATDNGDFSITLNTPKLNGEVLSVTATDAAQNTSLPDTVTAPDTTPPAIPAITYIVDDVEGITGNISNGQVTNDTTPVVHGTGEPGSTIYIYSGTVQVGFAEVDGNGNWEAELLLIDNGGYVLTAEAVDRYNNHSAPSNSWTIIIDASAPDAPAINQVINDRPQIPVAIDNNGVTNDNRPTLFGSGEVGATISIRVDGTEIGTALVGPGGEWSFTPTQDIADGTHAITAVATDAAGNIGEPSPAFTLTINTVAPTAPTITYAEDNTGTIQGDVTSNVPTDETRPVLHGTGPANALISIYDGTTLLGTATTDANGAWNLALASPLVNGTHALTATVSDAAGNVATSDTFNLVVDTTTPGTPGVPTVTVNPDGEPDAVLKSGDSTRDTTPTLSGTGTAGDVVTIYNGTDKLGETTIQPDGKWSWTPDPALGGGTYELSLTVSDKDGAGNESAPSQPVTITIDTVAPDQPGIPLVVDNVSDITGPVANNGATNDTRPVLSGTGAPDDVISIYDQTPAGGNEKVGEVIVDVNGNWSWRPETALDEGSHSFTVIATDKAGNTSPISESITVTVDSEVPAIPTITSVDDNIGPVTGTIDPGSSTNNTTPTVTGSGESGTTVILYSNGVEVGRGLVVNGEWSIDTSALKDGPVNLTVAAVDAAGNVSEAGGSFAFTLDTVPPAIPQILAISDSTLADGTLYTNSGLPTLSGTSDPGSTVSVYVDGNYRGQVQANDQGQWELTLDDAALSNTPHSITAVASDAAGNTSGSTPVAVIVDTVAPDVPDVTNITSGGTPLNGTAEPGSTVTVRDPNGVVLGTGIANTQGEFAVALTPPQSDAVTLSVEATDVAGNTSDPITFDVPATPALPDVPVILAITDDNGTDAINVKGLSSNDATPVVSGTAIPGSLVTLYMDGNPILGGTVFADPDTGAWSIPILVPLTEGNHSFSATATINDGLQTSGQSPGATVNIDLTAPDAPELGSVVDDVGTVVGALINGQRTNDTQPTLSGNATAGDTINIYANDTLLGSVQVSNTGAWSFTLPQALVDGAYALTLSATDPAGNESELSSPFTLNIDTVSTTPAITGALDNVDPVTGTIVSGGSTNDNTPTLSGTAEANSSVAIYEGTKLLGTVTAGETGLWSFTPTSVLAEGQHVFSVVATDTAGNVSAPSGNYTLVVDMTPPAVPVVVSVRDDVPGNTGLLTSGQTTNDTRPELTGTGVAGSTIHILDNGTEIGTVLVSETGSWSFTPTAALGEGRHDLRVSASDPAGNMSGTSPVFTVTVDTTPPPAPVVLTVVDDVGTITGTLISGAVTDDARPTFTGSGEVGATIRIFSDGTEIGSAVVNAAGSWTFTPDTPLAEGARTITFNATDTAGNSTPAGGAFTLTVDTVAPAAPSIVSAADNVGPIQNPLTSGQVTDDTTPTLSGTTDPNATVTIFENGIFAGTAQANESGVWTYTPATALGNGSHTFTASTRDAAGNLSETSAGFTVIVDTLKPTAPLIALAYDDVGTITGPLSNGQTTNDTLPTLTGTGEPNATIQIFEGQTLMGSGTADSLGNWSVTLTVPLGDATHNLTAVATDAAGNASDASTPFILTVDTLPPAVPVLLAVTDDVGTVTALTDGQQTNDPTPTLNGTGEAGATVSIYDGTTLLGTALIGDNNAWTFTPTTPLGNGPHSLTVIATDAAGNASDPTDAFTINVDTTPPAAPVIALIVDDTGSVQGPVTAGNPTNDTRPTLSGTAEANAVVRIYDGTTLVGEVTANETGEWTLTQTTIALTDGQHNFTATATDPAGNTSLASPVTAITVDTIAPDAPNGFTVINTGTTLTGRAEVGSTVTVYNGTTVIGTAVVRDSGDFSVALNPPMRNGESLTVTATDKAGNTGLEGSLTAPDTTPPAVPVITEVLDNVSPGIGIIDNGTLTNDATPLIHGTGDPNVTINLYSGDVLVGTTTTSAGGTWEIQLTAPLPDGGHVLTAQSVDGNSNASAASNGWTIIVDGTAPDAPAINQVINDLSGTAVEVANNGATNDNRPTLYGTGEPGATISIRVDGEEVGTALVGNGGAWTFTPVDALDDGLHAITVVATDAAGNVGDESPAFNVTINTVPPVAPTITYAEDNTGSIQEDVTSGVATDETRPVLHGTGPANAQVSIYDGSTLLGTATTDGLGAWSLALVTPLGNGTHALTATVTDSAGNIGTSGTFNLVVDTVAPLTPAVPTVSVNPDGEPEATLPSGSSTRDTSPTLTGNGTAGDIVSIYNGDDKIGETTIQQGGGWSWTPDPALDPGTYTLSLTVTYQDGAGNESAPSQPVVITIDTDAPDTPDLPLLTDNVSDITGPIDNNGATNDTRPVLSGTGTPDDVIAIFDNTAANGNVQVGEVVVDINGNWSWRPDTALDQGEHIFTTTATDQAGNTSLVSDSLTVTVDSIVPDIPVIVSADDNTAPGLGNIAAGSSTNDATPAISGTGESGTTVILYSNGVEVGRGDVVNGEWTITTSALKDGPVNLTVAARDAAGNVSEAGSDFAFIVDTVPPAIPQILAISDSTLANGNLYTNSDTPVISGTSDPNSFVRVFIDGLDQGVVQANGQGQWSLTLPDGTVLTNTTHTVTAQAADAAGNTSNSAPVSVIVDTLAPDAPTVSDIVSGGTPLNGSAEPGSTITVRAPNGDVLGTGVTNLGGQFSIALTPPQSDAVTLSVTASDVAGNDSGSTSFNVPATPALPAVPTIDAIFDDVGNAATNVKGLSSNDATPTLSGTAIPGSLVTLYLDGSTTPLGTVTADATTGAWTFPVGGALSEASHSFTATATVGGQTSGQSPGATVTIDLTPPAAPAFGSVVDDVGTVSGSVTSGTPTNDAQPTLNGTATPGDTINIYSGDTLLASVPVGTTGAWSYTPTQPLTDGTYTLTLSATDPAGNESLRSPSFSLVVDTVSLAPVITGADDNVGPVTGNVASGGSTNDNTPTLSGTAEANSSVAIYEGTRLLGTVTASNTGAWSFTPTVVLAEGTHTFTAIATDTAGNVSPTSGSYSVVVDMTPPTTPAIVSINDDVEGSTGLLISGQITNDARPELTGTGAIGSTVHILDNGNEIGTVVVDGTGSWSFTPTVNLSEGAHDLRVSATDAAGNLSGTSPAFTVVVDTVAPLTPTVLTVVDDVGTITGTLTSGDVTNDARPTITGSGEVGATVRIFNDGAEIGSVVVNAAGSWTFTPTDPLADGLRTLTFNATDTAGNTGPTGGTFTLTVDTVAPGVPSIVSAADNVGPIQTTITVSGQVTDDATPGLSGKADAGTTVVIYDNGAVAGTVQANGSGDWTFVPGTALANGSHTFTASTRDAAGNLSEASPGFTLIIDTLKPVAPTIALAFDDVGTITGPLTTGQSTNDALPTFSGTSEPNATVQLFEGTTLLGTATANDSGAWSLTLTTPLSNAQHSITAVATDAAGNASDPSVAFTLTVDTLSPAVPVLLAVTDDVGTVVQLTNGQLTNDARPTLTGTAEAGATVSIYDGATLLGTALVAANNSWTFTPTTALGNGLHTLTVTATDAVGNASGATTGFTINVDATPPLAPVIVSIVDDVGTITGPVINGNPTNDTRPTLNGTAEANAVVRIYDGATLVGQVTAGPTGQWSLPQTTVALTDGVHNFTATATDAAGNTGPASPITSITVDTIAPGTPGGFTVLNSGGLVNGTAEAGSTVTILGTDGVTVLGSGAADGTGRFSITLSTPQVNAEVLRVYATDKAGNVGLTVDLPMPYSLVPTPPAITSVSDNVGSIIGLLTSGQSTDDTTPTLTGTAQPFSTITLYDNTTLLATVTTNSAGVWTYTPTTPLANGPHAFTATAGNAVGTSAPVSLSTVIVDTVAPGTPVGTFNADGSVLSGTAEANSTITLLLSDNSVVTTTTNAQGGWSYTFLDKQSEGERVLVSATDAAGNTSAPGTVLAPNLPLSASDNVVELALTTTATTSTAQYSDFGVQLVGGVGNVLSLLGENSAQVTFSVPVGGSADMQINASATGIVLSLLNTLEVIVQRWNGTTWTTEVDTGLPQFANLLTLGASGVTLNLTGVPGGQYRVLSYNSNLLATGSYTSLDVDVTQTTAGVISGALVKQGNVITDTDPTSGSDSAPNGTLVTSITNANNVTVNVVQGPAGTTINGLYGTLNLHADGSYTYTLTNTSASVLGRTETFTYNIAGGNASDSARLVISLGANTVTNSVTAIDDTNALTFNTTVQAIDNGTSSQGGFTVVGVNLGTVLNLNLLDDRSEATKYSVAEGTTRTMTIQSTVGGVALASVFDLYIYKFNPATQSYERMRTEAGWLRAPLLGGTSGKLTLTLAAGDYMFLLNTVSGITALTSYRLDVLEDHVYTVSSVTAATGGNVLADDIVPAGSHVTQVNGVDVLATGDTRIDGLYGTLLINAQGQYTYTLRAGVGADHVSTPDSFIYTVTAPNGDKDTASLNITPTPQALDAVNDVSQAMSVDVTPQVAAYSDTSVGFARWNSVLVPSSGSGNGEFVVAANTALHDIVLRFNVSSLLSLTGMRVDWTITQGGVTYDSGTFNGGILLGGIATVNLSGLDLSAGTYTLNYTGYVGALGLGTITITPSVAGTAIYLNNELTTAGHTVTGNIYDGTDSQGVADQLHSVDSRLSVTGYTGTVTTLDPYTTANATATIQGHYGTLKIGVDGAYTYTLNSGVSLASMTTKETFTYKLTGDNGQTDTATLTINMAPKITSTEHSDTFTGSAYGDTLIYEVLNNTAGNGTGGNGSNDHWTNFSLAQGDKIDISDLLVGWNGQAATLGNYLHVTNDGTNTVISIDRDGVANTYTNTTLVTLDGVQTTYDELVNQNHIITS